VERLEVKSGFLPAPRRRSRVAPSRATRPLRRNDREIRGDPPLAEESSGAARERTLVCETRSAVAEKAAEAFLEKRMATFS
jgi:hypothetical protein